MPDAARIAAWEALSDLFLDTELDDRDIESIASRLRETGFGVAELTAIYELEVAPVCSDNLRVLPGGVWGGFDTTWLVDAIAGHIARRECSGEWPLVRRWKTQWHTWTTRADWDRVCLRLD